MDSLVLWVVGIAFVAWIIRLNKAGGRENPEARLERLESELRDLRREVAEMRRQARSRPAAPAPREEPLSLSRVPAGVPDFEEEDDDEPDSVIAARPRVDEAPPPLPPRAKVPDVPWHPVRPAASSGPAPGPDASIDWEKFLGVRLFAWLGGFALFLAAAFFVKYSVEHNLISPLLRVAIAFAAGAGAIVGGMLLRGRGYEVTVQSLCAAGVTILYADIFAARTFYQFISPGVAFALMTLVTATAFLLALRLNAAYVSLLGLVGGFLTPPLLSTGVDNPVGLYGYVAMLDVGLIAVALRSGWTYLAPLTAAATYLTIAGWWSKFFAVQKGPTAVSVLVLFAALFALAHLAARRLERADAWTARAAVAGPLLSMAFDFLLLSYPELGARPALVLLYPLFLGGLLAWLALEQGLPRRLYLAGGLITYLILFFWTARHMTPSLLPWGLGCFFAFALLHAFFPVALRQLRPDEEPFPWPGFAAPLALLLPLIPVLRHETSLLLWPAVLLINAVGLVAALMTGFLMVAGAVLVFTLAVLGASILSLRDPADLSGLLLATALFAAGFFAWGLWAARRRGVGLAGAAVAPRGLAELWSWDDTRWLAWTPALAAMLPFVLLVTATLSLRIADPSPVFGLALLLSLLALALGRLPALEPLGAAALLATAAVEHTWHFTAFDRAHPLLPLAWYGVFTALFFAFPFVFARRTAERTIPWAVAAFSAPLQFFLLWRACVAAFGASLIGLLPALLALLPLAGLLFVTRRHARESAAWLTQTTLMSGTALLFITLIFPLQFDKEWITVGWAAEGLALAWMLKRLPHPALPYWITGLLAGAFARLALNPAVLEYHARTATPLVNWYLYAYGSVIACLFLAARLLPPPLDRIQGSRLPPLFQTLGAVLAFLLLNIEIADYFSTGRTLTFQFSGSLAQDMTYSLGWGCFALALLGAGIRTGNRAVRLSSLGLFSATIVKVFLHDLWRLGQLYRVASILGLAVFLMLVSFLYQKFLAGGVKPAEDSASPPPDEGPGGDD